MQPRKRIACTKAFAIDSKGLENKDMECFVNKYLKDTFHNPNCFLYVLAALGEDGEDNSFAGQFDTFLEVPIDKVVEK